MKIKGHVILNHEIFPRKAFGKFPEKPSLKLLMKFCQFIMKCIKEILKIDIIILLVKYGFTRKYFVTFHQKLNEKINNRIRNV